MAVGAMVVVVLGVAVAVLAGAVVAWGHTQRIR
jgi:hypothetical protein